MKSLKLGLILTAFTIFIYACTDNKPANTNAPANAVVITGNTNSPSNANGTSTAANFNTIDQSSAKMDVTASAKKIYTEKCVACHKEDGVGGLTVIEGTKIKAPNFTADRVKNKEDGDYIDIIENGAKEDGMPAFKGKLSDDEIKNLVKFIRSAFQGK